MLLQFVTKSKGESLIVSLKVAYSQSAAEDIVLNNSSLDFVLEAEKNGTFWNASLNIHSKNFIKSVSSVLKLDLKSIIIHEGFSPLEKKKLIQYLQKNLAIEQSRLHLKDNNSTGKLQIQKKLISATLGYFNNFISTMHLEKSLIFEAYEDYHHSQQHLKRSNKRGHAYVGKGARSAAARSKMTRTLKKRDHLLPDDDPAVEMIIPHITVLNPSDPKYGELPSMENEFEKPEGLEWLTYYNEVRCIAHRKYYYEIRLHSYVYMIRLEFVMTPEGEEIWVGMYQSFTKVRNYTVIRDKRTQVTSFLSIHSTH